MKIKDTVKTSGGKVGIVMALETELGKDYASIMFHDEHFFQQILKSTLTVIPSSNG